MLSEMFLKKKMVGKKAQLTMGAQKIREGIVTPRGGGKVNSELRKELQKAEEKGVEEKGSRKARTTERTVDNARDTLVK